MRAGKIPVVASANNIATPDNANFVLMYKLSTDGKIYCKDSNGNATAISSPDGPKLVYSANLSQAGGDEPVPTVLGVNGLGVITWTRDSAGFYKGTLAAAFTALKTKVQIEQITGDDTFKSVIQRSDADVIEVRTYSGGVLTDGLLLDTAVTIEVYP